MKKNEQSLGSPQDTSARPNLHIRGVPEGWQEEKGIERINEEIMARSFLNLVKTTSLRIQ